jgi:hypothetical protein
LAEQKDDAFLVEQKTKICWQGKNLCVLWIGKGVGGKIEVMAGLPSNTKRFRHGRPDRGRR